MRIPPQDPKESEGIVGKAGVITPDGEVRRPKWRALQAGTRHSDLSFVSDGLAGVRSPLESRDVCGPHPEIRGLNPDPRILKVFTRFSCSGLWTEEVDGKVMPTLPLAYCSIR